MAVMDESTLASAFLQTQEYSSQTAASTSLPGVATMDPTTATQLAAVHGTKSKRAVLEGLPCVPGTAAS